MECQQNTVSSPCPAATWVHMRNVETTQTAGAEECRARSPIPSRTPILRPQWHSSHKRQHTTTNEDPNGRGGEPDEAHHGGLAVIDGQAQLDHAADAAA